ncbi:S1C family serine protease [Nocardioides sp. GCM10027113]|uniref:S1C family serine protease n=1 Tax=unclassified Nocardioides TaxID=2615069 RepID=UPI0036102F79
MDDTRIDPFAPRPQQPQGGEQSPQPFSQPFSQPFTQPPAQPPAGPAGPRPQRRGPFVAAVLSASLLVGGAAGFGGAAAWEQWGSSDPAVGGEPTRSPVVTSDDTPAEEGSVEAVAAAVLPSVVKINVSGPQGSGSGSGIILSSDGEILTNEHVVGGADDGSRISVSFNDGSRAAATVVGSDPLTDTAVIRAEDVTGLTPATIGSSGALDVGQEVVAIGSPFGLESTVTSGIVSALDRPVNVGRGSDGSSTTYPAIQTDAAINPGNSGGPLVNTAGEVVGINSSIRTASSGPTSAGSIGLGFAIPIDDVLPIVEQMRAGEEPTHARLGVTVSDAVPTGDDLGAEGARIEEVGSGSTAEAAGLEAGDIVTRVDDQPVTGADSLVATIRSYRPGDEVTLTFVRGGEERETTLVLDSDAE